MLEVLVVVSIIGVLAGVGAFGIRDVLANYRLKTEVSSIVSMLNKAKQWTVFKQEKYGVKFSTANETYTLFRYSDDKEFETKDSNTGIDIYESNRIHFLPEGTADYGEVRLKNSNGEKYRIYVYSVTGRISVKAWDEELKNWIDM